MINSSPTGPSAWKRQCHESIFDLCQMNRWDEVKDRVLSKSAQARLTSSGSTPLAFACRYGAPASCIEVLLEAAPENVRASVSSRGTPLHEAIICEDIGLDVIAMLLRVDESLGGSPRAAVMQDVDGHTPLHLLIRRRSPGHILMESNSDWIPFLKLLVRSCPEAAGIPDNGEYEEPPLVFALKANQYAATSVDFESNEVLFPRVEKRIHEMVEIMLTSYPEAASRILNGARGHYTALHSAVFHGRCADTIELLLQAEQKTSDKPRAALLANTQGEIPLHFAAMRGEPPRTIGVLGNAAPMAVLQRDESGLTPLHWLWIRFVSTLSSLDDRQLTGTVDLEPRPPELEEGCSYCRFWQVERGDFSTDLILMRRIDPPLDYFRMRHIPSELYEIRDSNRQWAERATEVLAAMRNRASVYLTGHDEAAVWTREEIVSSLFWVKVVSLLKAVFKAQHRGGDASFNLVHTAVASSSCPPPLAHIASLLFPEDLAVRDSQGRFPLHHAAMRDWLCLDWKTYPHNTAASKLLEGESLELLKNTIEASPPEAARMVDDSGRLVLHYAIDTFVRACCRSRRVPGGTLVVASMLETLKDLVLRYPESLERRDGQSKLYPFLQASASATSYQVESSQNESDQMALSIVYMLLRENPSLVASAVLEH